MKRESIPSHTDQSIRWQMAQNTELVRVAGTKRCCSKWEHHAMASHSAQQLLSSVPELRLEHHTETKRKEEESLDFSPKKHF